MLNQLINKIIGQYHNKNGYQKNYVVFECRILLSTILFSFAFLLLFVTLQFQIGIKIMGIGIGMLFVSMVLFRTKIKLKIINNIHLVICTFMIFTNTLYTGGILSPILPWLLTIPFIASFLLKNIYSWVWVCLTVSLFSILNYVQHYELIKSTEIISENYFELFMTVNLILLIAFGLLIIMSWNYFYKKDKVSFNKDAIYIEEGELDYFIINWNFVKSKLIDKYTEQIKFIDQQYYLTEHEKKYALINYLKIEPELIAEKLNVSKRTIETNLYRVRKKFKKNKINPKLLNSIK